MGYYGELVQNTGGIRVNQEQDIINEEENLSEILKIRREKLSNLQDEGKDPFINVKYERTTNTKDIIDNFET